MARANSLILPRSTVTTNGGISLPMTDLLSWTGIKPALSSWRAPGTRPGRARGTARAPGVHLEQRGLGAHRHADRGGGRMAHLDHRADRRGAGRRRPRAA